MIGCVIDESEFVLHAEEVGEEVGFPNVRLVGLYSDPDERCFYYVDSNTKEVLDLFPIKRSGTFLYVNIHKNNAVVSSFKNNVIIGMFVLL